MVSDDEKTQERVLALSLRALVEQLPFDVWVRGLDDKIIFANAAALEHWGKSVEQGRTVAAGELEESVADTWRTTNERALAGETVRDEVVYGKDNHTFIGLVTPFRDEAGILGTVGINLDVTGERRAREEAERLQTGLIRAHRLASLGTLSASIGHEIGTSAAVAVGQLEIAMKLVARGAPSKEVLAGLQEAQRALLRAVGVLRDMRALAVGATLGSEACDVGAAVDMVKEVFGRELGRGVVLHETRVDGAKVAMSQSRLVQILINLVRNALEATAPKGGTLWIEVTRPDPERVRIDVADDGPGIDAALREKLFQPFVSTKTEGTGLGLYVCSLLATASGGSIEALARDGGGVRMRVELPSAT